MRATEFLWTAGVAAALAASAGPAFGANEPAALVVSADGREVVNAKAGIVWSRCVEGMQWSGRTCVGVPKLLDHAQALAAAAARRHADGKPWRLPRAPELQRLASQRSRPPAREASLFPDAPEDWHWTSSTTLDTSQVNQYDYGNIRKGVSNDNLARLSFLHGWAVNMASGEAAGGVTRRSRLAVQLVRSLEP